MTDQTIQEFRHGRTWWDRIAVIGLWCWFILIASMFAYALLADADRKADARESRRILTEGISDSLKGHKLTQDSLKWHHTVITAKHGELKKSLDDVAKRLSRIEAAVKK